jgi:cell division protein ZapE
MNTKSRKKQPPASPLRAAYDQLVEGRRIRDDAAQREVLLALEGVSSRLLSKRSGGLLKKKVAAPAQGLYIWGNVGRGKSMLMDLFFQNIPVEKKRRVHFHAFMQEVHARIHKIRQESQRGHAHLKGGGADPVATLAKEISAETSLLCFDELQAHDVTDATLLYRLFHGLFEGGVTIVSTSNHPPASLYTGGIQRERFAKFIALIEEKMNVASLSSPKDYRRTQIKSLETSYVWPLGAKADAFIAETLARLTGGAAAAKSRLAVGKRSLTYTSYDGSIGRFTFAELCETALGPADYLAIARKLDTVILTGVPELPPEKRNEAKRFVTLIDALYEHKVKLLVTAAAPPERIYAQGDGSFEFQRTVSRLMEMQSANWMEND